MVAMETEPNNNANIAKSHNNAMGSNSAQAALKLECYEAPPGVEKQNLIPVENLEHYVKTNLHSGALADQYQILKSGPDKSCSCGEKPENKTKNRYSDLLPYDDNRVVLQKLKGDPYSDYINASYVDSYRRKNAYICTQGPLENTVGDFWRMIWQENVCVIAMTANIIENGRKKCEKYWPDKSAKYADVSVVFLDEQNFLEYTVRDFKILKSGSSSWRPVRQYHYTAWPDHGIPVYPLSLVFLIQEVESYLQTQQKSTPIVLHCSAGVGRTGTVIVLASALEMSEDVGKVDVLGLLYKLRQQRVNAIETAEQFVFVYQAMVDYLFGDIPNRKSNEMVLYFNKLRQLDQESKKTKILLQFERLRLFDDPNFPDRCTVATSGGNAKKNRNAETVPPDDARPILKTTPSTNYINAVFVPDYAKTNQYVVTQYPLPGTMADFWQLLHDLNCNTVVVLNELKKKDEHNPMFWPPSGSTYIGCFKLETISTEPEYFNGVLMRKLKVRNTNATSKSRVVKMFHLHGWPAEETIPPQPEFLVNLHSRAHQWHKKTGSKKPIVVTCYDGSRASGFFCAASQIIGQIKRTDKVDVFQAVRTVRQNRQQFVPTVQQYRWLYELACFVVANKKMFK